MATFDFASIANTKIEDVKKPPLPPIGHYVFQIIKVPESTKNKDETWEFMTYQVVAVEAGPDVEPDDLQNYGPLKNIRLRKQFMFNLEDETSALAEVNKMKNFLEKHVQCAEPSMSLKEAMAASVNQRFQGELKWRADKNDPEVMYAEIGKTSPIAD